MFFWPLFAPECKRLINAALANPGCEINLLLDMTNKTTSEPVSGLNCAVTVQISKPGARDRPEIEQFIGNIFFRVAIAPP